MQNINNLNNHSEQTNNETQEKHPLEEVPDFDSHIENFNSSEELKEEREIVASGDHSKIIKIKNPDGSERTAIESDYLEKEADFIDANKDEMKKYGLDLSGFSIDLALIDATHGKNFDNGDDETKANLLETFGDLKTRLENPDINIEEKEFIVSYLQTMNGKALAFLNNRYEASKSNDTKEQQPTESKEKVEEARDDVEESEDNLEVKKEIDEEKEELEKIKQNFEETAEQIDKISNKIDELISDKTIDTDELRDYLNKLGNTTDDLLNFAGRLNKTNEDFEALVLQSKDVLSDETYRKNYNYAIDNEVSVLEAKQRANIVEQKVNNVKKYIDKLENSLNQF